MAHTAAITTLAMTTTIAMNVIQGMFQGPISHPYNLRSISHLRKYAASLAE